MTLHAVVAGWLLGPPSGANRRLLSLLAHAGPMLQAGERITVLHRPDYAPPTLAGIAWQPIAIAAAPPWRRAFAERRLLPARLRALGATVCDHGFLPLPPLPVPTCLVVHDLRAVDGLTRWPRWFARHLLRSACARAAVVVTPSRWTAGRLRALAPRATIEVIPNGVITPAPAAPAPPLAMPANGYLLHVGHLEARKNLTVVVDALATLPAATRPELWLAGRDAGALRALVARCPTATVRHLGVVDEATLASLYHHARAVVLPSRHEGFGLPALEGLAHGRAVLVGDAGALPEVVGPCGVPVPVDDVAAWAQAIGTAAPSPDLAARARHLEAFQWPRAAARWLAVWRRIAP